MEPPAGFEPATYRLQGGCSTPELWWHSAKQYPRLDLSLGRS
jgi:hypothetical protein